MFGRNGPEIPLFFKLFVVFGILFQTGVILTLLYFGYRALVHFGIM